MVRKELVVSVPSYFRCPISLDVMKSPVSLCTGVTYDRSSIQKWIDSGHNTCPATMQPLLTKDFTPNRTLQTLIRSWQSSLSQSNPTVHLLSPHQALSLLHQLGPTTTPPLHSLSKIASFIDQDPIKNRDFLVNAGCVPILIGVFRDYNQRLDVAEAVVRVLRLVLTDSIEAGVMDLIDRNWLLAVLRRGSVEARIDSARILELVFVVCNDDRSVTELEGVLFELLRLMNLENDKEAADAGLSCLIAVSARRKLRSQIVRLGAIRVIGNLLSGSESAGVAEKALKMLEMLSGCAEGRAAICEDPTCVPAIVGRMLKVSDAATERAVVVLWSICHLFRDRKAQEAVTRSNGLTKILLLMQSNCSPAARQMCGDLVKIFRVNSKSCLSSYDTKTTHIMPF
ncbi:U-box domain-containing protein 27-like [Magnolia sinica]|uniref:U-box domain-containing protein 27-like n=1 Tax=Magnolia sinica TaxID=86752 RepID=UPI002657D212|nr:U-box domain-containing protein 27-like [Magnolia sinica]